MVETGTLIDGIMDATGAVHREFTLDEERFRHSLEIANDKAISALATADSVFYQAALLAKRLTVQGIETVTPDMILDLSGEDGDLLMQANGRLDDKRKAFRDAAQAAPEKTGGTAQVGD